MTEPQLDVLLDTETADPDDFFALCFLASHPRVRLRAVTVTPGTRAQVGVVRHVLGRLGVPDVAVGARKPQSARDAVSGFLQTLLGRVGPAEPDDLGCRVLAAKLKQCPRATVLTGAPLHNLRLLLHEYPDAMIDRWVAQGGFAGDNIVPPDHRLKKFVGRETCPSFNFNGDPKGAMAMLTSPRVRLRQLVSKNVCHGVVYDQVMHARIKAYRDATPGLRLMYEGMELYFTRHPGGKKFHDPLAACVAVDPTIATFAEVEVYQRNGEWGSRPAVGTNTCITIAVDRERFQQVLTPH